MGTTVKEKDLGVTISADMKAPEQCDIAASKGKITFLGWLGLCLGWPPF